MNVLVDMIEFLDGSLSGSHDRRICVGFFEEETSSWYLDEPDHLFKGRKDKGWRRLENKKCKILYWTLLPMIKELTDYEIKEIENGEW
jgi:hypothetical protein